MHPPRIAVSAEGVVHQWSINGCPRRAPQERVTAGGARAGCIYNLATMRTPRPRSSNRSRIHVVFSMAIVMIVVLSMVLSSVVSLSGLR